MGNIVLLFLGVIGSVVFLAILTGISVLLAYLLKALTPHANRLVMASIASGLVPMSCVALLLLSMWTAVDENFRGPEVLGFAIFAAVAALLFVVVWPISLLVTYRTIRDR